MKKICLLIALLLAFGVTAAEENQMNLYVKKVENLPEDFIFGMDVSSLLSEEASGVVYYDFDGNQKDLLQILSENGINMIRVRVWNDPKDAQGRWYGGGNCDIDHAVDIGRRAALYGLPMLIDFHYSDFWADPSKQMVPKAWTKLTDIQDKAEACYQYTKDCLLKLKEAGVKVSMVQAGNETNGKMCGEKTWFNIQYLMQACARATREVYPDALVALHFANPEKAGSYETYAKKMDYYHVDYDVFATSYYPFWHGTLDNLASVLSSISETYGKKVMVVETSYPYTAEDTDFYGNTVGASTAAYRPFTVQGQANSLRALTDTIVNKTTNGIGIVYWEGAWISVGQNSWEENYEKWEKYGSGWASSWARAYDPNDAGKYFGGCAVDNQAMFDKAGHPLLSLKVFRLMRTGNETEAKADALETARVICDVNGEITLPSTVNAVMTDDTKQEVPVSWQISDEELASLKAQGVGNYPISGLADGMEATCILSLQAFNFLRDGDFEEGSDAWTVTDLKHADELYVEDKSVDSLSGTKHLHFWSSARDSVEFTAEQTVTNLPAGAYSYSISIMGGDCAQTEIYAYALVDGQEVGRAPMQITVYNSWDTATIDGISCTENQEVRVGIYVRCQGEGSGAWGKIDDAKLNSSVK